MKIDIEIPTSMLVLCERDELTGGNLPIKLVIDALDENAWFQPLERDRKYDMKAMRLYGDLPVRKPEFYSTLSLEIAPLLPAVADEILHGLPHNAYKSHAELMLVDKLNAVSATFTDQAIRIDLSDLGLPASGVPNSLVVADYLVFPQAPTFTYDRNNLIETLQWWVSHSTDEILAGFIQYLRTKNTDDMYFIPHDFRKEVDTLRGLAAIELENRHA